MAESVMLEKSKEFAISIVKICKVIMADKHEYVMTKQLIKSGTSIGANIYESKYGHSTADFISKMQIALKECYESEYWLELLYRTEFIDSERFAELSHSCGEIRRMLVSSINTVKSNKGIE
ncbi:MAG: four helix bundle protein [Clostridia bacterium]|nr:four helix bundle protein [Clostridia bacterium]